MHVINQKNTAETKYRKNRPENASYRPKKLKFFLEKNVSHRQKNAMRAFQHILQSTRMNESSFVLLLLVVRKWKLSTPNMPTKKAIYRRKPQVIDENCKSSIIIDQKNGSLRLKKCKSSIKK